MKKLSLFLMALCMSAMVMAEVAPKVTLNFKGPDNFNIGTAKIKVDSSFTYNGDTIRLIADANNGYNYYINANSNPKDTVLFMGKSGAAIQFQKYDFAIAKIVLYGGLGASANTKLNVFVGDKAVSTEVTGCKGTNTFIIDSKYQVAGTQLSLKVTNSYNAQFQKIEIYEAVAGAPADPKFSPEPGLYFEAQMVSLSCDTPDATIQYSYDGVTYENYSSPISVSSPTIIYAKAIKNSVESNVVSAYYNVYIPEGNGTKENPFTVKDVLNMGNPGDSAWVIGVILGSADTGGKIKKASEKSNILIGTTAEDSTGVPVALPKDAIKNPLNVVDNPGNIGKTVKVYGALVSYFSTNGMKNTSEYELIVPAGTPEKPTFSVPAGTYTETQYVEIACETQDAVITYSFDNETYVAYTEPVVITKSATLYAKATKNSLESMASAVYNIVSLEGDGTKENPYTIADLTLLNNPGDSAWVGGYIIGCANSSGNLLKDSVNNNNVLIGDSTTAVKGAPIKLATDMKEDVGLVGHSERIGKFLKVYGAMIKYCGKPGVQNISDYEIEGGGTGFVTTKQENVPVKKMMINGQMVIIRDGKMFNALGAEL